MEYERLVTYQGDSQFFGELDVRLRVVRATVREGIKRTVRKQLALEEWKKLYPQDAPPSEIVKLDAEEVVGMVIVHNYLLPDLIAATVEAEGLPSWPLDFEDYLKLPEDLNLAWEKAVYALNPHWAEVPEVPDEKKASTQLLPLESSQGPQRKKLIS